jgi:hypothetical protein
MMRQQKNMAMAFSLTAARMGWLLIGPLVLQPALEAVGKGLDRSPETLLAQAPGPADAAIPKEVQGWFDAANAAAAKDDLAEALRLQKQVVAWVQANLPSRSGQVPDQPGHELQRSGPPPGGAGPYGRSLENLSRVLITHKPPRP